jgi:glycosyltransferase involved in cell wall biosynthesis
MNYPGRLAIQQRVLTPYRAALFDALAAACDGGVSVCAGLPRPEESIALTDRLAAARFARLENLHLLRGPFYVCWQRGLLRWLEQEDPSALVVEANPRYLSTPAAIRWMQRRGRPVLGWGLGAPPLTGPLAGLRRLRRIGFLRQFDALLTYSRQGAQEYASLGFPAERIFVAPNAASPAPAWSLPERPAGFAGRPNVLFVGRLQARKRVDLLLAACAALPETLQPKLTIVGEGPESAELRALAGRIYPQAEFAGAKHGPDLAPYFRAADLFVLPGTGGLAVQEAMSYGLPVIMGKGDGTNDDLVRPANGWQLGEESLQALTGVLVEALSDAGRLRRMGAESYRIVAQEINLEKMVEVFVGALNGLAGSA